MSMSRWKVRITRLERRLAAGLKAELAAMLDEELERRLVAGLRGMSEEDRRLMVREYPDFFTPDVLEKELAHWQELHAANKRATRLPLNPAH